MTAHAYSRNLYLNANKLGETNSMNESSQLPSVPVSSGSSPRVPSRPPSQPNPHQHQQPQQRVVLMQSSNGQLIALPAGSHFPKQGNAQIVQQQVLFFIDFVILVSSIFAAMLKY